MDSIRERPILFSAAMVAAILDGRKTQTRRVVKPQPVRIDDGMFGEMWEWNEDQGIRDCLAVLLESRCPYGQASDRLWVREAWRVWSWIEGEPINVQYRDGVVRECGGDILEDPMCNYERWAERVAIQSADDCETAGMRLSEFSGVYEWPDGEDRDIPTHWRPSIHMPRWASRITLEVVAVRAERLQEITYDDVVAEGAWSVYWAVDHTRDIPHSNWLSRWIGIWDSINAKRGYPWDSNPWVWVVEFEKQEN